MCGVKVGVYICQLRSSLSVCLFIMRFINKYLRIWDRNAEILNKQLMGLLKKF